MFGMLLGIIYLAFISLGLPDSLLGSAWPSMYRQLHVPAADAGILSMLIAGCTILSSLLCARAVRRLGTGRLTACSVGLTAAALCGFSVSHSFWQLCLWALPYGLGAGAVDAALNNYVALHYKASHMNWLHCCWGVGATVGPYIMGLCLTGNLGWQAGYRTISLIQAGLTILLIATLPLWKSAAHRESAVPEGTPLPAIPMGRLLRLPGALPILAAFFCYCSLEATMGLWGSSYLVTERGVSPKLAASLISLFYLGITGGRMLCGFLMRRLNKQTMIRIGQGTAITGTALLLVPHFAVTCAGLALIGLGCAPIYPCLLHQTPVHFGRETSQSMMGLQMACAYVGSTFSPALAGRLFSGAQMAFLPVLLLALTAGMVLLVETGSARAGKTAETG